MANKDQAGFDYYWAQHVAVGSAVSQGWVPAPHIYCDAYLATVLPGLDYYFFGQLAGKALGHQWLRPSAA